MSMHLTGQTMPLISVFKMADRNAGAIQSVPVEIKYISSNNVTIDTCTENCKPEPSLTRVSGVFTKPKRVWDGMETSRRNGPQSSEKPQGEMTTKTYTDARQMMKLCYLEPDCVISTFEFIISSFSFVSKQSKYIRRSSRVAIQSR